MNCRNFADVSSTFSFFFALTFLSVFDNSSYLFFSTCRNILNGLQIQFIIAYKYATSKYTKNDAMTNHQETQPIQ